VALRAVVWSHARSKRDPYLLRVRCWPPRLAELASPAHDGAPGAGDEHSRQSSPRHDERLPGGPNRPSRHAAARVNEFDRGGATADPSSPAAGHQAVIRRRHVLQREGRISSGVTAGASFRRGACFAASELGSGSVIGGVLQVPSLLRLHVQAGVQANLIGGQYPGLPLPSGRAPGGLVPNPAGSSAGATGRQPLYLPPRLACPSCAAATDAARGFANGGGKPLATDFCSAVPGCLPPDSLFRDFRRRPTSRTISHTRSPGGRSLGRRDHSVDRGFR
jgi:hypothetical protein